MCTQCSNSAALRGASRDRPLRRRASKSCGRRGGRGRWKRTRIAPGIFSAVGTYLRWAPRGYAVRVLRSRGGVALWRAIERARQIGRRAVACEHSARTKEGVKSPPAREKRHKNPPQCAKVFHPKANVSGHPYAGVHTFVRESTPEVHPTGTERDGDRTRGIGPPEDSQDASRDGRLQSAAPLKQCSGTQP
ncbi:hypothetical protein FB451DRAFT_1185674 [Mycena latifolia]|nr:hypothetical protein FB451DRAFT_1185674 [Mycena latifolia]